MPNKACKTIFTIIGILLLAPIIYLFFWQYKTPWKYVGIFVLWIELLISFCKLGWISNSIILKDNVAKKLRNYSLILYLFQDQAITLYATVMINVSQIAFCSIAFFTVIALSIPRLFVLPKLNNFVIKHTKFILPF